MIKMKRRVESYNCAQTMIRCGRCRLIQKTPSSTAAKAFRATKTTSTASRAFRVYQFFSAFPDNLKYFCRGAVRDWQWTYVNEERFLKTITWLEQMDLIPKPAGQG